MPAVPPPLKLGFDNYAIRAVGWDADQLLRHAAAHRLDYLFLSDLEVFPGRAPKDLHAFRQRADDLGIRLHVGTLSICPNSVLFNPARGCPEQQLRAAIRTAHMLGSPIARCVLGKVDDRFSDGGIAARIEETLDVLRGVRTYAQDADVVVALENHAGDLRSAELVELIQCAGADWVGATYDSGNACWALEDPLTALETLAPHIRSTGIRDSMLWSTDEGAILQWTAIGDGLVDWPEFFRRFQELCPEVPVLIETISGRPNLIPFAVNGFDRGYPNLAQWDTAAWRRLVAEGRPLPPFTAPDSDAGRQATADHQLRELERSIAFCRETGCFSPRPAMAIDA